MNTILKRILSLMLCFVLLAGCLPAGALAAEVETTNTEPVTVEESSAETDPTAVETTVAETTAAETTVTEETTAPATECILPAVFAEAVDGDVGQQSIDYVTPEGFVDAALFFSDLHTSQSDYKESTILSVFGGIATSSQLPFSSVTSVGDAFSSNESVYTGYTSYITEDIRTALQDSDIPVYYAWSDHDRGADIENVTGLLKDTGNYYIYSISMTDMGSAARYGVASTFNESKLTDFTETINSLDHTKPLFIVSHVPLHDRRNDNDYADEWYGVISEAAKKMDIAFFWGHNHTSETSADRDAYYVAKNGTEKLAVEGLSTAVVPNFTYLNAGYMNESQYNASSTRENVATVVTICDEYINYTVYDKSGEYTGTYSLNEDVIRDHAEPTLNTVTYTDERTEITATSQGLSDIDVSYDTADVAQFGNNYYVGFEVALTGYTNGNEVTYTVQPEAAAGIDLTLYYVNSDGSLEELEYETSTDDNGATILTFTTNKTGTFAYGVVPAAIPEGAELSELVISGPDKKNYFLSTDTEADGNVYLDIEGLVVTAVYTHEGNSYEKSLEWNHFDATRDAYGLSFGDLEIPGKKTVTVSYGGMEKTFDVWVCAEMLENADKTVRINFSAPSVISAEITAEAPDASVTDAVQGLLSGNLVAYHIEPVYGNGDTALSGTASVTLPIPEGVIIPAVMFVPENGGEVEPMPTQNNGDGTLTFTTTHFSVYVVGQGSMDAEPEQDVTTGGTTYEEKTVYVRVDSFTNGEKYLLIGEDGPNDGNPIALVNSNGSDTYTAVTVNNSAVTVNGTTYSKGYIELNNANAVFTASGSTSNGFTLKNGNYYIGGTGATTLYGSSGNAVRVTYDANAVRLRTASGTTRYLYYSTYGDESWKWSNSVSSTTSSRAMYIYQEMKVQIPTSNKVTYTMSAENMTHILDTGAEGYIKTQKLTYALLANGEAATLPDGEYTFDVYNLKNNIISGVSEDGTLTFSGEEGEAKVKITYTWKEDGQEYVVYKYVDVKAVKPFYTLEITHGADNAIVTRTLVVKEVQVNSTYELNAKLLTNGDKNNATELNPSSWSSSDTSIATVDSNGKVTFTGGEGTVQITAAYEQADNSFLTDIITISVSRDAYIVPEDGTDDFPEYPNEGAVRYDKTATAVGIFSETGIAKVELSMTGVPFTTGSELDVVLMLDRSSSMTDTRIAATREAAKVFARNVVMNEDGTYNGNRILIADFLGGNPEYAGQSAHEFKINEMTTDESSGFQIINDENELNALLAEIDSTFKRQNSAYGTEYAQSLQYCYNKLDAVKSDGHKQFCVFMSDGIPNVYQYGETQKYESTSAMEEMFTGTNYNTRSSKYHYEYYSTEMKKNGVTVFSVGLGLNATNSAWDVSATHCLNAASLMLNDISGPALEAAPDAGTTLSKKDSYFFSVADAGAAAQMANVFSSIAQKILDAATDVVVEDKVGDEYSLNFSLPKNVTAEEADDMSEFYIQAVEYTLNEKKERTGEPAVLENFTFNADGTFKSHTVNGVVCSNCSHVNEGITVIDGTYFDYKKDSTGEYLTWTAEKLTTTELALQYFAHLDNSSDAVGTNHETPAGTYYTNEYATLTYTNYKGNRVQQEFPVPQMTWNGAQVSYTFYLVNDAGEPVNRAGRVVPFAEAVYVTDVFTYSVVWNDLEQSAGLEAKYLADKLVPEIYALYDDDASYNIHVYEDEDAVNLNNHFVINGNVTDDYNTVTNKWPNANTTYVFNNKSDETKYNTAGAYIANDGETTDSTTYLCKGEGTVTATIEVATVADEAAFKEGVYYVKDANGNYVLPQMYEAGATYYAITKASYTAATGETQAPAEDMTSTSGGTVIGKYVYYIDENNEVYTIVSKSDGTEVREGFDFHNTTVAFAVVWKPELAEDTVVVDYGLDVVIDVITNDGMAGGVVGVRADKPANVTMNSGNYTAAKAASADVYIDVNNDEAGSKKLKIGTATVENLNAVRFSLDKTNGMQFTNPAEFYYEADVNYYDAKNELQTTSMYSKVTVIPATTVYYEENFVTFTNSSNADETNSLWTTVGTAVNDTQDQDRPGPSKISDALDADNAYGYDSAYENMGTYSMGGAKKATVSAGNAAVATFTFYGTGFDVISLTSNTTGSITVKVYDSNGDKVGSTYFVDTYYGYKYENGEWVVDNTSTENSLYQIPVIKVSGLDYGKYSVEIKAAYNEYLDHTATGDSYDFYLDAIRIYNPTGNSNTTANNAYIADGEWSPEYHELRDLILSKEDFIKVNESAAGVIFIDNTNELEKPPYTIEDYKNYGPNNELYLKKGQSVAFELNLGSDVVDVQMGLKTISGKPALLQMVKYDLKNGTYVQNSKTKGNIQNNGATDLYYSISDYVNKGGTVALLLTNMGTADSILSITNIKIVKQGTIVKEDAANVSIPAANSVAAEETVEEIATFTISRAAADAVLATLNAVEEEIPEETIPETTEPEMTEPEETVPETTVPEETAPEETEPEIAEPEETLDAELQISIRATSVKIGSTVVVMATTSADVEALTVNGNAVAKYVESRLTGKRTWTTTVKATQSGNMDIEVIAYSAKGEMLDTAVQTIQVSEKNAGIVQQIIGGIIGMLFR